MSAVPIRHRRLVEYALHLPAPLTAVAELLDTARGALRADGRPLTEATVRQVGGELVVSYALTPEAEQTEAGAVARRTLGFA
ncbi:hypothetical protein [Streptomyces sp. ODS28]|uniref:hypothetical protein n=1 Tax=Streptomyces sp. ODS28 TaxID=3136688 RepID=UPI0031E50C44